MDITPNQKLDELDVYSPVIINYNADSDHTSAKQAFVAPFAMRIVDIIVKANATNASGTLVPRKGADAMCTGIACATDGTVSRLAAGATVANDARLSLVAGDIVNIISSGGTAANTRGFVTFIAVRV
ncbi:MAG: hypothetical protein C0436_00020 [Alphaproteobacteria bacterium]|nr:hypothetical protein [Alphaproteobacteria bacterium]